MREKLWNLLDKMRYEYNYYQEYRQHLERMRIGVIIVTSVIVLLVINLSLFLDGFGILWHLMLLASGIIATIYEKLMIADKLTALRYFIPEVGTQLNELNAEWINVNDLYEYTDEQIAGIFTARMSAYSKLTEKYTGNLLLTEHKKSALRASEVTKQLAEQL
jgi:hypothetical protein